MGHHAGVWHFFGADELDNNAAFLALLLAI